MTTDFVLSEAKRVHALGFAVLLLHPKSKRPKGNRWTSGPRTPWEDLKKSYRAGDNIGVRLGEPSKLGESYLTCIDVDIKEPIFKEAALTALKKLIGNESCPEVRSGSGNGSRHLYCRTTRPFKMLTIEKHEGWEICVYSSGRQMVLPPSIHPSGKPYKWVRPVKGVKDFPLLNFGPHHEAKSQPTEVKEGATNSLRFEFTDVELEWLSLSKSMVESIKVGTGVKDRSAFLLPACSALHSCGLTRDEILSVLTDPKYFISSCALKRRGPDRQSQAQWLWSYALEKIMAEKSYVGVFEKVSDSKPDRVLSSKEIEIQNAEMALERNWRQDLKCTGKNGSGIPQGLVDNVFKILINAVGDDVIKRNLFARRDHYGIKTPWGGVVGSLYKDEETIKIKHWLSQNFSFEPKSQVIEEAVILIANKNAYDPVKDWIETLKWDGTPRLGTWLKKHFHAKGDEEYLRQVFTKWVLAMIARAYRPGLKFDWMPIFEGAQGIGKSSFGRLLVGDEYFLDSLPNITDKDSSLALQGIWAVEMGELANMRRAQLEDIKSYLTRTVDKVRAPYGRRWEESPRRCVFFGTTNRQTYLVDDTGNRRFKPVEVGALNFKVLRNERPQLFAEAKHIYETEGINELTFELTGNAKIFEASVHQEKMVEDEATVMKEAFENFIKKVAKNEVIFDFQRFRILDLFSGGGGLANWKADNRNYQFAAKMLRKFGAKDFFIQGLKHWKIEKIDDFLITHHPGNFY